MKKKKSQDDSEPVVYIPPDARLNFNTINETPPKTKYDKRQVVFGREEVKKIAKGKYGS